MHRLVAVLVGLFLLLTTGVLYAAYRLVRDVPPPDTSDLVRVRPPLAAEDNAFPVLAAATNAFYWPDDEAIAGNYLAGKPVDEEGVREILRRNAPCLEQIRRGVQYPSCQVPEVEGIETVIPYLSPWMKLGKTLAMEARMARLEGDHARATDTCLVLLRFGDLVQADGEGLLNYLVGRALLGHGIQQTLDLAVHEGLTEVELGRLAAALDGIRPAQAGLEQAYKVEYRCLARAVDQLGRGEIALDDLAGADPSTKRRRPPLPFFQPNATKQLMADYMRRMIWNSRQCFGTMVLEDTKATLGLNNGRGALFMRRNPVGRILCGVVLPTLDATLDRKCESDALLAAARLITALRRHELKHGCPPANLTALVPEFLSAVPADPFDGRPFRYAADRRIIYSVGPDLADDGGSSEKSGPIAQMDRHVGRFANKDTVFEMRPVPEPTPP